MDIVNLTPHELTILVEEKTIKIPSSGIARISVEQEEVGEIEGIPVVKQVFGEPVVELKEKVDLQGKVLVVSSLFAGEAAKVLKQKTGAAMVCSPNTSRAIRNEEGHIIGVPGLVKLA